MFQEQLDNLQKLFKGFRGPPETQPIKVPDIPERSARPYPGLRRTTASLSALIGYHEDCRTLHKYVYNQ
jgi:hypothetical protein